jgi:hypothetical protein
MPCQSRVCRNSAPGIPTVTGSDAPELFSTHLEVDLVPARVIEAAKMKNINIKISINAVEAMKKNTGTAAQGRQRDKEPPESRKFLNTLAHSRQAYPSPTVTAQ